MVQLNTPSIFGAWQAGENAAFQQKQRQMQIEQFQRETQAAQAAAEREAKIREMVAAGVNPGTQEGLGQLLQAGLPLNEYQSGLKNIADIDLAKQRGEAARMSGEAAQMRGQAAMANVAINERKVNGQLAKWARDSNFDAQNRDIAWQRMQNEMSQQQIEFGSDVARSLAGISDPKQRQTAYTQLLPTLRRAFPTFEMPDNVNDPAFTATLSILGTLGGTAQATGKPVAVIDPNTGQAIYVTPDQAIGKQVASTRTPGQTEESKQRQKSIVKAEESRAEAAANATAVIDSLNRAEQLVSSGAANTGPIISKLYTVSAGTAEFEAISNQLGLQGTALLKGAITEAENRKVQSTQPGSDRTPESNLAIINFNRSIMQRAVERGKFDAAWRQSKGTIEGADAAWQKFVQENPITSNKPNDLSINQQNIGNWQGYVTGQGKQLTPAPTQGAQPQAGGGQNNDPLGLR